MFTKNFRQTGQWLAAFVVTIVSAAASAQAVTVVEYYNRTLDSYFVTGRASEQQQLDGITDFQRTGMTFQAVAATGDTTGLTRICRFYVSLGNPFTSTHFYGREGTDCESIRAQAPAGFSWEGYDFALQQPSAGACPMGTVTVYRSFRPGGAGRTSNHRYSTSASSYAAAATDGYNGEQSAFCAAAATDVFGPAAMGDCGTMYFKGARVSYQSLSDTGAVNSWVRYHSDTTVPFNGQQGVPVVERYPSGPATTLMIEEATESWTDLGIATQDNGGTLEVYYTPATQFPRKMAIGQRVEINRSAVYNPIQNFGSPSQVGHLALIARENVTTPAGGYSNACKFTSEVTTTYAAIGRTVVTRSTTWIASGVGVVKSQTEEISTAGPGSTPARTATEVQAVAVQPL